ncbi:MAG: hypothetical protein IKN86_08830 [Bacteroidaceae bacterium]|nr:hypothetical protein [Bacteroidaceae bacterium]
MKQKLLLLVALLCSAFSAQAGPVSYPGQTITSTSDYYFLLNTSENKFLNLSANGTVSLGDAKTVWCITKNADDTYTIGSNGKYIYIKATNDNYTTLAYIAPEQDNTNNGGSKNLHAKLSDSNQNYASYNGRRTNSYQFFDYIETTTLIGTKMRYAGVLMWDKDNNNKNTLIALWEEWPWTQQVTENNKSKSMWVLVKFDNMKANMTISKAAEYGTFVAPFDVTLPADVTAYQVESFTEADNTADDYVEGDIYTLNLKAVAGAQATTMTLPANTPVIVHAAALNETLSQDFYGNPTGTKNANTDGFLTGTYELQEAEVGTYILQYEQERAAFLLVSGEEELYCGKNRAYLTLPEDVAAAGIKAFNLSGIETGITRIPVADSNELQDNAIYDLSGRRLAEKPARGLYIQNGKKILVK